ncbi:peptide deformylase [Uliginosibacterium flavum]|uniref:Peptide deformylase n=1 Tax=Uliginosibacterium flavum TaxID=1396831 RepID=A0ABV2TIQ0_9RHOO
MIRPVLRMGDPRLLERATELAEFDTPELHALIADMLETMEHEGGVGLAAPQIGVGLRLVVFEVDACERYPDAPSVPQTVLINPELEFIGEEMEEGWEGCLSVPGLRGVVPRHVKLRYSGFDQFGRRIEREAEGFHARVVQHECDHLDGTLYPMRVQDFRRFGFVEALAPASETE